MTTETDTPRTVLYRSDPPELLLYSDWLAVNEIRELAAAGRLVEVAGVAEISWCFAHSEGDIRRRQYSELSCPRWHPDDECRIGSALVVEKYPEGDEHG